MARRPAAKRRYQPHPMLASERTAREKVERETGRSWAAWLETARTKGPKEVKALGRRLGDKHGLPRMPAQWLAHEVFAPEVLDYGDPEPLVDALYAGERARLRPLHEAVVDTCLALGDDVVVTACKTMVPVYRKHVFAQLKPAQGAVEVQVALGEAGPAGRLRAAAGRMPGDRLSHSVLLTTLRDVNGELEGWLAQAYALGAGPIGRSTSAATPPDLTKGLEASATARATWETCTPAMRRDMIQWVTSAKQAETRSRRLTTALTKLAAGQRRVY